MKIALTGANSAVGQTLLTHIAATAGMSAIAGVRSERAAESLPVAPNIEPRIIDYGNHNKLAASLAGAQCVVHLAGILIEAKGTSYESANVEATKSVVEAAKHAGLEHIIFISVLGADENAKNRYLKSKGEAERLVETSGLSSTIIRTPILFGPGTAGADALVRAASQGEARLLGGGNYTMRPLDIDDLSHAILGVVERLPKGYYTYELGGPEPMAYRDIIKRFASLMGTDVSIGSVPIWLAKAGAAISSRLSGGGISPAVIDIITDDEHIKKNADVDLGISLTPLDDTLLKIIDAEGDEA